MRWIRTWAIQCKQERQFGPADATRALKKTTFKADLYTIFLSREASVTLRRWERQAAGWTISDVRDLSAAAKALPPDLSSRLVRSYFDAETASAFDGLRGPTPFIRGSAYFKELSAPNRILAYDTPIVGRDGALADVDRWLAATDDPSVALLVGRGGVGKTKLLFEIGTRATVSGAPSVWFLDPGNTALDGLARLPLEHCTVVIDDAHRRHDEVAAVLALRRQRSARIRVLLTTRPEGVDGLRATLARNNTDVSAVSYFTTLRDLDRGEALVLATSLLGDDSEHEAERIVTLARGCPLVTVVGARIAARGAHEVSLLNVDEFRDAVLDRFREALLGEVATLDRQFCRRLLRTVAAIGPVPVDKTVVTDRVATFVQESPSSVRQALATLERCGVLAKRGGRLRIVPDVLSDFILEDASLAGDQSTRYATEISTAFGDLCMQEVLRNFAELDWRSDGALRELDEIWRQLATDLKTATPWEARRMLDVLRDVAFLQPERTLELARHLWPTESTETTLIDKLGALLGPVAHHLPWVSVVCDLLWDLLLLDTSNPDRSSEHPARVLADVGAFELLKPIEFNEAFIEWAERRWAPHPDTATAHTVASLEPLLAKAAFTTYSDGLTFTTQSFVVDVPRARGVSSRAAALLLQIALAAPARAASRATRAIAGSSGDIEPLMGLNPSPAVRAQFLDERLANVARMARIAEVRSEPVMTLAIGHALAWHARHATPLELRQAAERIVRALPDDDSVRLHRALAGRGFDTRSEHGTDWRAEHRRWEGFLETVVRSLEQHATPAAAFEAIERALEALADLPERTSASPFSWMMASLAPDLAASVAVEAVAHRSQRVGREVGALLSGLFRAEAERAVAEARRALATGVVPIAQGIAEVVSSWLMSERSDVFAILELLLKHEDAFVRSTASRALARAPAALAGDAVDQLLTLLERDDESVRSALSGVTADSLDDQQLALLLSKLDHVSDLDDHAVRELLEGATRRNAVNVFALFMRRVARERVESSRTYDPIPHGGLGGQLGVQLRDDKRRDALQNLLSQARSAPRYQRYWHAALLAEIGRGFDAMVRAALEDLVRAGDTGDLGLAIDLVRGAPEALVFDHVEFVRVMLTGAERARGSYYDQMSSALAHPALSGGWTSRHGEPPPRWVTLRDRANEACESLRPGSPERRFFEFLLREAKAQIEAALRADEAYLDRQS